MAADPGADADDRIAELARLQRPGDAFAGSLDEQRWGPLRRGRVDDIWTERRIGHEFDRHLAEHIAAGALSLANAFAFDAHRPAHRFAIADQRLTDFHLEAEIAL